VPPAGPLTGDPQGADWGGHRWDGWQSFDTAIPSLSASGLYRIRDADRAGLLYIGEGSVAARLTAHRRKTLTPGDPQGAMFGSAERAECSWVVNAGWLPHQRLELECDLIGAHLLVMSSVPPAQFIG
jgi:hypothetical protein